MPKGPKKEVSLDCMFLVCDMIMRKAGKIIQRYCRKTGVKAISKEQYDHIQGALKLHQRFLHGDYTATEDDLLAMWEAGQVLNDLHQECESLPKKTIDKPMSSLWAKEGERKPGDYGRVMRAVAMGAIEGHSQG